jgi:hypothetical protein
MPEHKLRVFLQIIIWVFLPTTNVTNQVELRLTFNAQLTELAMITREDQQGFSTQYMML